MTQGYNFTKKKSKIFEYPYLVIMTQKCVIYKGSKEYSKHYKNREFLARKLTLRSPSYKEHKGVPSFSLLTLFT